MVRAVKSHRVGQAMLDDGLVTPAYRAVVAFECGQCAKVIAPGALFSRQTRPAPVSAMVAPTTVPICIACRPLGLEDGGIAVDG